MVNPVPFKEFNIRLIRMLAHGMTFEVGPDNFSEFFGVVGQINSFSQEPFCFLGKGVMAGEDKDRFFRGNSLEEGCAGEIEDNCIGIP